MTARKANMHRAAWTRAEAIRDLARPSARRFTPAGFSCDSGTFALFVGYDGKAAEPGKPAVAWDGRTESCPGGFLIALDCPALRGDIVRIVRTLHDG
jgi:hypothetical protein